jgi:hypothetical protein
MTVVSPEVAAADLAVWVMGWVTACQVAGQAAWSDLLRSRLLLPWAWVLATGWVQQTD